MAILDLSSNNIGIDLVNFVGFSPIQAVAGTGGVGAPTATMFTTFGGGSTTSTDQVRGTFNGVGFTFDASNKPTGGTIRSATISFRDVTFINPLQQQVDIKMLSFSEVDVSAAGIFGISGKALTNLLLSKDDTIIGSRFADTLYGGDGNDLIGGGEGDDTVSGDNGNDRLDGGNGADTLFGGANEDVLTGGIGNDKLYGDAGDDTLLGGLGNDMLDGGGGTDTASFADAAETVHVRLDTGTATGQGNDTLVRIENVVGSRFYDSLFGNSGVNLLFGGGGDDYIDGLEDDDQLHGEVGNDTLVGGTGNDFLAGGDGNDRLFGNNGRDFIEGGEGHDQIDGGAGNDLLYGGAGDDHVFGGLGNDYLVGNAGNDRLTGGGGGDYAVGGGGADVFALTFGFGQTVRPMLQVEDFQDGVDRIDLSALGLTAANWSGGAMFTQTTHGLGITFASGTVGTSIFLNGITMDKITTADFLF
jgi:Ca2+-binding RTX toxin-like protein